MTIDLGALTGTAKSAEPKTTKTSKTSDSASSDFSHTLAASRSSRGQSASPKRTHDPAKHADSSKTAASNHSQPASHHQTRASANSHSKSTADGTKPASDGAQKNGDHPHIARRRLSATSLIARQTSTPADETKSGASRANALAAVAKANIGAKADADPGERAKSSAARDDTPPDDSKHRDAKDKSAPGPIAGPIAALIQAPLVATDAVKPGGAPQAEIEDAAGGRSSPHANALNVSLRRILAQIDAGAASGHANGQTNDQTNGQANGRSNDPAQLLSVLTSGGQFGTRTDADGAVRFGVLQRAGHSDSSQNNGLPTATVGHALNHASAAQTAGPGSAGGTPSTITLGAPLASDDWKHALGQQTLRLAGSGQNQAQIQLHPRELGQINISVSINDQNQAQVHLAAAHAHVRDAVEAALPQLRQSLAAGGLSLGQTSVGDQNSQAAFANDDDPPDRRGQNPSAEVIPVSGAAVDTGATPSISRGTGYLGGIDIFA